MIFGPKAITTIRKLNEFSHAEQTAWHCIGGKQEAILIYREWRNYGE